MMNVQDVLVNWIQVMIPRAHFLSTALAIYDIRSLKEEA